MQLIPRCIRINENKVEILDDERNKQKYNASVHNLCGEVLPHGKKKRNGLENCEWKRAVSLRHKRSIKQSVCHTHTKTISNKGNFFFKVHIN